MPSNALLEFFVASVSPSLNVCFNWTSSFARFKNNWSLWLTDKFFSSIFLLLSTNLTVDALDFWKESFGVYVEALVWSTSVSYTAASILYIVSGWWITPNLFLKFPAIMKEFRSFWSPAFHSNIPVVLPHIFNLFFDAKIALLNQIFSSETINLRVWLYPPVVNCSL